MTLFILVALILFWVCNGVVCVSDNCRGMVDVAVMLTLIEVELPLINVMVEDGGLVLC